MSRNRFADVDHLNPGVLRHRVTIYSPGSGQSSATGAYELPYTDAFASNVPVAMNPAGGHQFFDADSFNTENLDTCLMRYLRGINDAMQVDFEGRRFEIVRITDVNERHKLHMLALRRISSE